MQRTFLSNLGLLLVLNILIKPFWIFGIDREVQNIVGATEYGNYFALLNFSFLCNILLDLGINNFNNRNIAQNKQLLSKHVSGIFGIKLLLALFFLIVIGTLGVFIGYSSEQFKLLGVLALNQILISFIYYFRSNLSGLHLFKTDSIISVLDRIIMIIFCGILLWTHWLSIEMNIKYFVLIQTAGYLLTAMLAFGVVLSHAKLFRLQLKWSFMWMIIKKSSPFALLIALMMLYNRIDSVMIERIANNGKQEAGIYAQGYRILDAFNMVAYLFAGLLLPIYSRMIKKKENIQELTELSFRILIVPATMIALLCFIYNWEIMHFFYVQHVARAAIIFKWLMLCFVPVSITYIFGTLLTAKGDLKHLNIMALLGVILNVILNIILIRSYGALGAAYATFITQGLTAIIQVVIASRLTELKINIVLLFKWLLFSLLFFAVSWLSLRFFQDWRMGVLFSLVIGIGVSLAIKLVNIQSFYNIFIKEEA